MRRAIAIAAVVLLALAFAAFVWPTPYVSRGMSSTGRPVRENRVTHNVEWYEAGEWKPFRTR